MKSFYTLSKLEMVVENSLCKVIKEGIDELEGEKSIWYK